jgi:hypothetical protein
MPLRKSETSNISPRAIGCDTDHLPQDHTLFPVHWILKPQGYKLTQKVEKAEE